MRPILLLLAIVLVLASGATAYVATRMAVPAAQSQPEIVSGVSFQPAPTDPLQARVTEDKLAFMAARIDALTSEIETLRNAANRAPVASPAAVTRPDIAGNVAVNEIQRATVLAVLEENRVREAKEAQEKRDAADIEAAARRAARVAKELSLSPGDESRLADLMVESGRKRQELFEGMRNGNFDRDLARTQFDTFRTWQTEQLSGAFGQTIAEQILKSEGDRMGFGGGPGGQGGGNGAAGRRGGAGAGGTGATGTGGAQQN